MGDRLAAIIQCHDPLVRVTTETGMAMAGSSAVWSEVGGTMRRTFLADGVAISMGDVPLTAEHPSYVARISSAAFGDL